MNSTFESMTHDWYSLLFDQAKKMDEPLLTEENVDESQRVHKKFMMTQKYSQAMLPKNCY